MRKEVKIVIQIQKCIYTQIYEVQDTCTGPEKHSAIMIIIINNNKYNNNV